MMPKLSVVVPCYNEQERFKSGLSHYYGYLKKQNYDWEIVFVNDGSTDSTLDLIKEACSKNKNIRFVSYSQNHGKGYAIVQGMRNSMGKYVLFTDLDHSVDIKTIDNFFKFFEQGYKVVIGSRRINGARLLVRQKPFREFLGRGFTLLVNLLIIWGVKDATCGFKAFENSVVKQIFENIRVFNWSFDAEILYLCKKKKIVFAQAPVWWSDARGSRVRLKRDVFGSFVGLLKIRLNDMMGRYG